MCSRGGTGGSKRPSRRDRRNDAPAETTKPVPIASEHTDGEERLRHLFDDSIAHEEQPERASGEDDADLHGPEDAAERRPDRLGRGLERQRCRLEKALRGRRLHVGQKILVRREPIHELVVHVGMDLRRAQPSSMFHERADYPDEGRGDEQEHRADGDEVEDVPPDLDGHGLTGLGLRRVPELHGTDALEEKPRRVTDFGVLLEKRREGRIGCQVRVVAEERRVGPEDSADGRRELLEQLFQLFTGLTGVLILIDEDLRRRLGGLRTLDWRTLLLGGSHRCRQGQGKGRDGGTGQDAVGNHW